MTVENFYKRFLKENGLYFYSTKMFKRFSKHNRNLGFDGEQKKRLSYMLSSSSVTSEGILKLFQRQFQYESMFCGDSRSAKRRRYYRLNRKWRDSIRGKAVIQHNVSPGDILTFTSVYGDKREYIVKRVSSTGSLIVNPIRDGKELLHYHSMMNVICFDGIKSDEKDLIVNLYTKNSDGTCYGKIDGDFTEIQL